MNIRWRGNCSEHKVHLAAGNNEAMTSLPTMALVMMRLRQLKPDIVLDLARADTRINGLCGSHRIPRTTNKLPGISIPAANTIHFSVFATFRFVSTGRR